MKYAPDDTHVTTEDVQLAKVQALMLGVDCCALCRSYRPFDSPDKQPRRWGCGNVNQIEIFVLPHYVCTSFKAKRELG